jgi:putative membrane protein
LPVRRASLAAGVATLVLSWLLSALGLGMVGHMAGHMIAVAVSAPLLAWGLGGTRFDLARIAPQLVHPLAMSVVELGVVWGWHLPALRALADTHPLWLALEQASFLAAGVLLWAAVLGAGAERRMRGIGALLLTSMHMTLLGALIGLAPRPLYPMMAMHGGMAGLDPLEDQQLGGVVMLLIGGASYFLGALALLGGLVRQREEARA